MRTPTFLYTLTERLKNQLFGKLIRKMLIFMVSIALLPLVISYQSIFIMNSLHRAEVGRTQDDIIEKVMSEMNKEIDSIAVALQLQYNRPTDRLVSIENNSPIFDIIKESEYRVILDGIVKKRADIELITIVDGSSGLQVAVRAPNFQAIEETERFKNAGQLESVKEALGGKLYVGRIYATPRGFMIDIAVPLRTAEGNIPGVVVAKANVKSAMQKIVSLNRLKQTGYVYITDEQGRMLVHSLVTAPFPISLASMGFVETLLAPRELSPEFETLQQYESFWGKKVIASGGVFPQPKLAVVVEWPIDEANALIDQVRGRYIIFTVLVLNLSILLSIFIAQKIVVGPIKILEAGTKRIAWGRLDEPVIVKTGDEIEGLAMSFNEMMKGLKQLEELREEFVFIAAHELRTPVTAIKGYIQMVLEGATGPLNDKTKEFLTKVVDANKRLVNLVNDLLEVARSEAGRLTVTTVPLEMVPIVRSVLSELKPLADEKSIQFVYNPDSSLPKTMADEGRLKEVLVNLIGNAIKYTIPSTGSTGSPQAGSLPGPEGPSGPRTAGQVVSGTVTIRHEVQGEKLTTHIQDTGVGISKEAQKKLFEKFYRVQTEQTQSITGTGLGLFIVKQIVEKMNGTIWVTSEEGRGSTFSFSLPLAP